MFESIVIMVVAALLSKLWVSEDFAKKANEILESRWRKGLEKETLAGYAFKPMSRSSGDGAHLSGSQRDHLIADRNRHGAVEHHDKLFFIIVVMKRRARKDAPCGCGSNSS